MLDPVGSVPTNTSGKVKRTKSNLCEFLAYSNINVQNVNLASLCRNVSLHHDAVLFEVDSRTSVFASHVARDATGTLFCKSSESLALGTYGYVGP